MESLEDELPEGWPEEFHEIIFVVRIKPPLEPALESFLKEMSSHSGPLEMVLINPKDQKFLEMKELFDVEEGEEGTPSS